MSKVTLFLWFVVFLLLDEHCSAISRTDLLNSKVIQAEYFERPIDSGSSLSGRKRLLFGNWRYVHAGVVVTISPDRSRWLIHKGRNYGDTADTVITSASNMSNNWSRLACKVECKGHSVDDYMQAGLVTKPYDLIGANCQTAAHGMMHLSDGCDFC